MIKQKWVFSIIKALECRLFYLKENDDTSGEIKTLEEAVDYFNSLDTENEPNKPKE